MGTLGLIVRLASKATFLIKNNSNLKQKPGFYLLAPAYFEVTDLQEVYNELLNTRGN